MSGSVDFEAMLGHDPGGLHSLVLVQVIYHGVSPSSRIFLFCFWSFKFDEKHLAFEIKRGLVAALFTTHELLQVTLESF